MAERYCPVTSVKCEDEIKQSRFIAFLLPHTDKEEIKASLAKIQKEHSGAAHVVYAFIIGDHSHQEKGMSDDGEPSGTAGKPILALLEGNGYINLLLVVVRYFGGVKLGTGGLVRAYAGTAALALKKAAFQPFVNETNVSVTFPYAFEGQVTSYLKSKNLSPETAAYSDTIHLIIPVKSDHAAQVANELTNVCSGRAEVDCLP